MLIGGKTAEDFKRCISYNNGIRLQEFNIAIVVISVVLCVKVFMYNSYGCVLRGTPCVFNLSVTYMRANISVLVKRFLFLYLLFCVV